MNLFIALFEEQNIITYREDRKDFKGLLHEALEIVSHKCEVSVDNWYLKAAWLTYAYKIEIVKKIAKISFLLKKIAFYHENCVVTSHTGLKKNVIVTMSSSRLSACVPKLKEDGW